jgi:predicted nucleotidyltransferase
MHTPTTINKIVALLAKKAKEIASDKLVKVILYGSYARGDYEEWSDIDVMVLVNGDDHTTKLFEQELWKYCNDLELNYDVVLSVIVKDYNHFQNWKNVLPFYANLQNAGVLVNA